MTNDVDFRLNFGNDERESSSTFLFPLWGEGESTIKGALPPYNLLKNNKQKIRTHWGRKGIFLRVRSNCDKCQEMDDRISTPPEAKVLAREYYLLP